MIERLCDECDRPVTGKLFRGMCRTCYDRNRQTTVISIPKKMQSDFEAYMEESNETVAKCVIELVELGLKVWKKGKRMILVPIGE